MTPPDTSYNADHITVLKGLEPVRRRPGMYIGGTDAKGYHHLLWEIVDNSVDEVINGYATHIDVILHKDHRSVTVTDNGRGIPVDIKKEFKKSALELVLTVLHAGGKFSSGQYQYSGGLHGVGSSVVNALSEEMIARVKRDGFEWEQRYARGEVASKLGKIGAARGTGTSIFFRPDPQIFGKLDFSAETICFRLETKTFLHKDLKITFRDEAAGTSEVLQHDGGIADFLGKMIADWGKAPTTPQAFDFQREDDNREDGIRVETALQWTESHEETLRSYVNGIPTTQGGAHEQGLRQAIVKAVRSFMDAAGLEPKTEPSQPRTSAKVSSACCRSTCMSRSSRGKRKNVSAIPRHSNWSIPPSARRSRPSCSKIARPAPPSSTASCSRPRRVRPRVRRRRRFAQDSHLAPSASSREAGRLLVHLSGEERTVHRRGRFRRRLGQARSRAPLSGDSPVARQGAERGASFIAESSIEQGTARRRVGARLRRGRGVYAGAAALPQDHLPHGRGFRRPPHRDAVADVFLSPSAALIESGNCDLARAAAISHRPRQGNLLGARRGRPRTHRRDVAEERAAEVMRFKGLGEMQPEELKRTTLDPTSRRLLRVSVSDVAEADRILTDLMGKDVEAASTSSWNGPRRPTWISGVSAQADGSLHFRDPLEVRHLNHQRRRSTEGLACQAGPAPILPAITVPA